MLDSHICSLVSIVSLLNVAQVKHHIHQWLWYDSRFEFMAIIHNGSKQHIIIDKVKIIIWTLLYFVTKIPNFQVILL